MLTPQGIGFATSSEVSSPASNFHAIGAGCRAYDINDKLAVGAKLGWNGGGHGGTQDTDAFICDSSGQNLSLLDALLQQGSPHMVTARFINNKGAIVCEGVNPNGWYLLKSG